jgi:hypothetical protein
VVIPAYNEASRLPATLDALRQWLNANPQLEAEVLVVDDGSTDGTVALVRQWQQEDARFRLLCNPGNKGKGYSVRRGFMAATKALVLMMDADGAVPMREIGRFVALQCQQPAAILIGSRVQAEVDPATGQPVQRQIAWYRRIIGQCFHAVVFALAPSVQDTQCGFKLFPTPLAQALAGRQTQNGFAFDVELLHMAAKNKVAVREVGVTWVNQAGSKVNLVVDSAKMFVSVLRIAFNTSVKRRYRHIQWDAPAWLAEFGLLQVALSAVSSVPLPPQPQALPQEAPQPTAV